MNAINAEWGSAFYNISLLVPTTAARITYFLCMSLSNVIAIYFGLRYLLLEKPMSWSAGYLILGCGLVIMRQGFVVLGMVKSCRAKTPDLDRESDLAATDIVESPQSYVRV
jgi:hypothetical protein